MDKSGIRAVTSPPSADHSSSVFTTNVWRLCGIPHKSHTFAVNNLRSWFERGDDVGGLLPVLQTYMGHSSPDDTAYYLRLTAESYPHITAQIQRVFGDVVPPVTAGRRHGD